MTMKKDLYLAVGFTALLVVSAIPLSIFGLQLINFVLSKIVL
jgi:hypothetical protein